MIIEQIHAREILDSRGNPTVEVEVTLEVPAFPLVLLRVRTRPLSFATVTRTATSVRV